MRNEKIINRATEFSLWIYLAAVFAVIIYAICIGYELKTPGEILHKKPTVHQISEQSGSRINR